VLLLSGGGDRLDHTMAALIALGHPSLGDCKDVRAIWGASRVHVLHAPGYWELELPAGTTFSLLALHGECTRVTVSGARWPLTDATIEPASSLGISNLVAEAASTSGTSGTSGMSTPSGTKPLLRVSVGTGVLTLIIPNALTPSTPPGAPS
jgi:thiamine pyrophosphokinase